MKSNHNSLSLSPLRYAGYCPQLKYHLGKTYGQLTAKLLSSPEVSRSRRLVLHTGCFPSTETDTGPRDEIWRSHHGERRNLERMIPGYTGKHTVAQLSYIKQNSFSSVKYVLHCVDSGVFYRLCSQKPELLLPYVCRDVSRGPV